MKDQTLQQEDTFRDAWIEKVLKSENEDITNELIGYWNLMDVHSKLLKRVTKGKLGKTNYTWEAIEGLLDEIEADNER